MHIKFITSETGAVTVDWVVLTAALVGLGLATMAVVSQGVEDTSDDIDTQLRRPIISSSFSATHFEPGNEWYVACDQTPAQVTAAANQLNQDLLPEGSYAAGEGWDAGIHAFALVYEDPEGFMGGQFQADWQCSVDAARMVLDMRGADFPAPPDGYDVEVHRATVLAEMAEYGEEYGASE